MRLLIAGLALSAWAGCSSSVCDTFEGETCIAVEVRGAGPIDQLRLTSTELGLLVGNTDLTAHRAELIPRETGSVLEIGVGSG